MHPPADLFERILSKPRLDSYRAYWKVSRETAVGLYLWNGEVCGELSKLLAYFEIILRNSIHRELSLAASRGTHASVHWWDVYASSLKVEARSQIQRVRAASCHANASPDEVVSRLTFGFWPNTVFWIAKQFPTLPIRIFPFHDLSTAASGANWFQRRARQAACQELLELNAIRNRIAHHEPLWKFPALWDTSPIPPAVPQLICPASTDEPSTLMRFERLLQVFDRTVHALSPAFDSSLKSSSWRSRLEFLLSPKGLQRFKEGRHVAPAAALSVDLLQRNFSAVVKENRPVRLMDHGGEGIFVPL